MEDLRRALPVDGVLLALHGSLVADGAPDVEGDVLQALRRLIGPRVPLVATLDLHAFAQNDLDLPRGLDIVVLGKKVKGDQWFNLQFEVRPEFARRICGLMSTACSVRGILRVSTRV